MSNWVSLRSFPDLEEAIVVQSLLRSEGIAATLGNEHLLTCNPPLRLALGGFPLMVLASDCDSAHALLIALDADAKAQSVTDDNCTTCGGGNMLRKRSLMWALIGLAYAVPYAPYSGAAVCKSCGEALRADRPVEPRRLFLLATGIAMLLFLAWQLGVWGRLKSLY